MFLIIVYPNSRNTEVRARCNIRGTPVLGAANRLDLEELVSFDREAGSSSSMLQPGGWAWQGKGHARWKERMVAVWVLLTIQASGSTVFIGIPALIPAQGV